MGVDRIRLFGWTWVTLHKGFSIENVLLLHCLSLIFTICRIFMIHTQRSVFSFWYNYHMWRIYLLQGKARFWNSPSKLMSGHKANVFPPQLTVDWRGCGVYSRATPQNCWDHGNSGEIISKFYLCWVLACGQKTGTSATECRILHGLTNRRVDIWFYSGSVSMHIGDV